MGFARSDRRIEQCDEPLRWIGGCLMARLQGGDMGECPPASLPKGSGLR
jgi:hypothetical protein